MKLNGEDWLGIILSCAGIFLTFFITVIVTGSINFGMGALAAAACIVGGAYFAAVGYFERMIAPRCKRVDDE